MFRSEESTTTEHSGEGNAPVSNGVAQQLTVMPRPQHGDGTPLAQSGVVGLGAPRRFSRHGTRGGPDGAQDHTGGLDRSMGGRGRLVPDWQTSVSLARVPEATRFMLGSDVAIVCGSRRSYRRDHGC